MPRFYTDSYSYYPVQPSDRGEYEISDAIDLLIQSGRAIDAIGLDGWRIDVGYPEDREEAERRLSGASVDDPDATTETSDATETGD